MEVYNEKLNRQAQKILDANCGGESNLLSVVSGYEFDLEKSRKSGEWYIRVNPVGDSFLYDGWWACSEDKTLKEAVIEAIIGVALEDDL